MRSHCSASIFQWPFPMFIFRWLYNVYILQNESLHKHGSKSYYLHNWNFQLNRFASSKLLLTISRLCTRLLGLCALLLCIQHVYCADDLESDYYQSMWHFRHITSSPPQVCVCVRWFSFSIPLNSLFLYAQCLILEKIKQEKLIFLNKQSYN